MPEISSKNRVLLFMIIGALFIVANIFCYIREFQNEIPLRDYTASEQLLYHPDYAVEGYAPDALIREIVRGRTVLVPRDVRPYKEYPSYGHMHEEDNPFSIEYFSENNYNKYFSEYAGNVTVDPSLPDLYELELKPLDGRDKKLFSYLGRGHDMMRYAFLGDHTDEETTTQFFYSYFYTTDSYYQRPSALNIYILADDLEKDKKLVALWDTNENLFLMSKNQYEKHLRVKYDMEIDTSKLNKDAIYNSYMIEGWQL